VNRIPKNSVKDLLTIEDATPKSRDRWTFYEAINLTQQIPFPYDFLFLIFDLGPKGSGRNLPSRTSKYPFIPRSFWASNIAWRSGPWELWARVE